jgi:hypothetical protein
MKAMPWGRITEHRDEGRVTWAWGTIEPRRTVDSGEAATIEEARRQYRESRARGAAS